MTSTILNVLHLPDYAGTEAMYVAYSKMLANAGHRVVCLMPENAQAKAHLASVPNVQIVEDKAILRHRGRWTWSLNHWQKLLQDHAVKLVMTQSGGTARLFKRAAKDICPVLTVNHCTNPKQTAKADYAIAVNRPLYNNIVACGMPASHVKLLFNAIEMKDLPSARPFHTPPVIGYLGRFAAPQKRVDDLIRAAAELTRRGVDYHLLLGGDGEQRAILEALVKDFSLESKVTFVGWVENKADFFDKVDVIALCSEAEGFPLSLLEAIGHAKPIICSDFDGHEDLFPTPAQGSIFPRGDIDCFAGAIAYVLADEPRARRMAKSAFAHVQHSFSFEKASRELNDFVAQILHQNQTAAA